MLREFTPSGSLKKRSFFKKNFVLYLAIIIIVVVIIKLFILNHFQMLQYYIFCKIELPATRFVRCKIQMEPGSQWSLAFRHAPKIGSLPFTGKPHNFRRENPRKCIAD